MLTTIREVLDQLEVRAKGVVCLTDPAPSENGNWLIETADGDPLVLRRYHDRAFPQELAYEHEVVRHAAAAGWVVPEPVGPLVQHDDRWYCLTRFVPGQSRTIETSDERRQRGGDLAGLELGLRELGEIIGQRPGWRAQHTAVTVHTGIDWDDCVAEFALTHPRLAAWASDAASHTRLVLDELPVSALPLTIIHGDFAEWNVHYDGSQLMGVIDFGLTHLDTRPYELAIARTYRAPEVVQSYLAELSSHDWPLSDLEVAAIEPLYRAFRVDMVAWQLDQGRRTGNYDVEAIERQLARSGAVAP